MKNVQIALATLLVAAWGCEPQPPEACDTIPNQTVNVRDLVRLTPSLYRSGTATSSPWRWSLRIRPSRCRPSQTRWWWYEARR